MVTVTKMEGGTAVHQGEPVRFREHWVFDAGNKGTARIYIREEPCTEAQRKKNRDRLDDAVREMWKSVQMKRAAEAAGSR